MDPVSQVLTDRGFCERYDLGDRIGTGGIGAVYRGIQRSLKRPVAIKFINPELAKDQDCQRRFLREAEMASGLIHPNIVTVFPNQGLPGKAIPFLKQALELRVKYLGPDHAKTAQVRTQLTQQKALLASGGRQPGR